MWVLVACFALVANFFDFLTHLNLSCMFLPIFLKFGSNLEVLGRFWGGFGEVFAMIFCLIFEKGDFVKIELSPRREHEF